MGPFLKIVLGLAGVLALLVGLSILSDPVAFYSDYQAVSFNSSWLNELRASGSYLIASGLLIMAGVFFERVQWLSLSVGVSLYLSFALGRLLSVIVDGLPGETLMAAAAVELLVGLLLLIAGGLRLCNTQAAASRPADYPVNGCAGK